MNIQQHAWEAATQVVAVVAAAGFVAGLLGIGGALILNPFLRRYAACSVTLTVSCQPQCGGIEM